MTSLASTIYTIQPSDTPQQLFLLVQPYATYHTDIIAMAQALNHSFSTATIVIINLFQVQVSQYTEIKYKCLSQEYLTEAHISNYVATTLTDLMDTVKYWQEKTAITPVATALLGFSYSGATCLEAAKQLPLIAGRVIAHSSPSVTITIPSTVERIYAKEITIHLIHGKKDLIVPHQHSINTANWLNDLNMDFTADILPDTSHAFNEQSISIILQRLSSYIPKRLWNEAMWAAANT